MTISPEDVQRLAARPLVMSDASQIAEINREMESAEPADAHWSVGEVAEEMQSPTADLPRASIGLFDGDRMVAYSMVAVVQDEATFKPHIDGGVRTAWTRRGLGTRVLQTAEEQAADWKQRDAPELAGELTLWLEESRISTVALAQAQGYETWRYFFRMRRDLSTPVDIPDTAAGFTVRPFGPQDAEPARIARNLSFADHWGSVVSSPERWQAHMVGSQAFRPDICFVALFDDGPHVGEVAAFVLCEEFVGGDRGPRFPDGLRRPRRHRAGGPRPRAGLGAAGPSTAGGAARRLRPCRIGCRFRLADRCGPDLRTRRVSRAAARAGGRQTLPLTPRPRTSAGRHARCR